MQRPRTNCAIWILIAVATLPVQLMAQAGATHLLSTTGIGPSVQSAADGSFLVVWAASNNGILARRVSSAGVPVGSALDIRQDTTLGFDAPSIARLTDGTFVVVWHSFDGYDYLGDFEIAGRKLDSSGTPVGDEFAVNENGAFHQRYPHVQPTQSGGFVVDWTTGKHDIYGSHPWHKDVRSFDAAGMPWTGDLEVTGVTSLMLWDSHLDPVADGGFIVSWTRLGESDNRFARRLDSTGAPTGGELSLDTIGPTNSTPRLSALAGGGFRVVWADPTPETGGVRFGYADEDLNLFAPGQPIETETGIALDPEIVVDDFDRPITLWRERRIGEDPGSVSFFRYLSSQDGLTSISQPISDDDAADTIEADLSLSGDHGILVWRRTNSPAGLYVRAFSVPLFLDGFESGGTATWNVTVK